ncbi:MAG: hypothetical protein IT538_02375 [Variibacter sp.]|nr:hypothetical protein [Variibacter sp.]
MSTAPFARGSARFARALAAAERTFARVKTQRWFEVSLQVVRVVCPLALIGYLAFALMTLGWTEITRSLPTSWLFYLLIPVSFLIGPLGELISYRYLWGTNQLSMGVVLRKCFMNGNLVDLSGEAYLFMWAKRNLRLPDRFVLHTIKDNCVLSANASMAVLFALLAGLALSGHWMMSFIPNTLIAVGIAVTAFPLILIVASAISRKQLLALGRQQATFVLVNHGLRTAIVYGLTITMWSVALPSVPLVVWLNFLAIRSIVGRFSFIPNAGILALTAGIGVAGSLGMPTAGVAAVLLTLTAGDYLMQLLLVGVPMLVGGARDIALRPRSADA